MKPTKEMLEKLCEFDTPTLCNAIECFHIRGNTEGLFSSEIRDIMGYDRPFVGYAVTAKIRGSAPEENPDPDFFTKYYSYLHDSPKPTIAVIEDLDEKPIGSFWGEVNAHIHKSLGVVATVTNGGVRDIREVRPMNFGFFATCKLVSHGYVHPEACDCPVNICGLTVNSGDIVFCDQYGAITIPEEIVEALPAVCRKIALAELPVIQNCKKAILAGELTTPQQLNDWVAQMMDLRGCCL